MGTLNLSELYENKVFQFHYSVLKSEGLVSCNSENMESEGDKFPRSIVSPPHSSHEFELPLVNDLVNGASTPHHHNVPSINSLMESGFNSVSNDSGIASEKDHDSCADNDAAVDDTDPDKMKNALFGKVGDMANVLGSEGEKVMEGVKSVVDVMPAQGRWWSKLRKPR